ncbi:putative major facilitator superfamily transporter protein [Botrytis fragariae]|uniref:Putative major facilitator superfamily transporter protein n=1 Tax=Botrytis fragariae TaxID=1964551 RepID=A0A8H6AHA6_9HELO|nr:putative major facilitator superfamily transporter protein [Botrytis fragariae]KAF5867456.1 putative major facilitator superfamily transporter protein [Botrytis fragariae]
MEAKQIPSSRTPQSGSSNTSLKRNPHVILQPRPSNDPNDPLNWPRWRKNLNFILISYYTLIVFTLTNIATVTWAPVNDELGFSYAILTDAFAASNAALCIGGFLLVPLALKFGRRPLYIFSTAVQCGMSIWYARMHTVADLMLINLLTCAVGSLAEVMVQMTVADMFYFHERGLMNSIYYWFMITGAALSPLPGGIIISNQGWRWVWWWLAILLGAGFVVFFFCYEETMFTRPTTGTQQISSQPEMEDAVTNKDPEALKDAPESGEVIIDYSIPQKSYWQKLKLWSNSSMPLSQLFKHTYQPLLVIFTIPAVFFMAIQYGILISCIVLPVTSLSSYMTLPPYEFNPTQIGLMGLASFTGSSLGALIGGFMSDYVCLYLAKRNGGVFEPEMRLWVSVAFAPFVPAGTFIFGISLNNGANWLLPAFGLGITCFGVLPTSSAALTYLTDAYTDIIADSIMGVTFVRNAILTIFMFALQPWSESVGLTWVYVTFGLITAVILVGNIVFIYFGKKFRINTAARYQGFSDRKPEQTER